MPISMMDNRRSEFVIAIRLFALVGNRLKRIFLYNLNG